MINRKIITGVVLLLLSKAVWAQADSSYIPCTTMPSLMQSLYADFTALDRIYTVNNSPERRERYDQLSAGYLAKLKAIPFNSPGRRMPGGLPACKKRP